MSDAVCVRVNLLNARHQLGKIPDICEKLAHFVDARSELNIVGVTRFYSKHRM